jgi:hypothetical protein
MEPNMAVLKAVIQFVQATGRFTASTSVREEEVEEERG